MTTQSAADYRWFVKSDIDGFFGLALDNFVQLLLIANLCTFVLGFDAELLYGRVLPAAALSIIVGNIFYAWQAVRLARRTGRTDVCALPYGINTISLFAFIFLVMLPAKLMALQAGMTEQQAAYLAWQAGLIACLGSGVIEFAGAFVAKWIRQWTPRAALLSTLAGIALGFISLQFLLRTYAHPVVGLSTLGILLIVYFGNRKFIGGIPGGLVAVVLGTMLYYLINAVEPYGGSPLPPYQSPAVRPPVPVPGDLISAFANVSIWPLLPIMIPMGLFGLIGSIQNLESAEAAGDKFDDRSSLMANGIGTLVAACFGSCFPTTLYIGHPGWKQMGARAGYSILDAGFVGLICFSGSLAMLANWIPIDATMAIVLWIGIVIAAQAFTAVPQAHAPAVVIGIMPGIAAWGMLMVKSTLSIDPSLMPYTRHANKIIQHFMKQDVFIQGGFALEQGFLLTSMTLAAAVVAIIRQRWAMAGLWFAIAAILSASGLMHSYQWTDQSVDVSLTPALRCTLGYLAMALICLTAGVLTVPNARNQSTEPDHEPDEATACE